MADVRRLPKGSLARGALPRGCVLCARGAKMVLLVTGRCGAGCWYCPLSAEKAGRDVTFADEMRVRRDPDVLKEGVLIEALGTGLTGGDPLCAPGRTLRLIRLLKRSFGKGHHVHLYTAGRGHPGLMKRLAGAGLDEIRFHPHPRTWGAFRGTRVARLMEEATEAGMAVGAEVPAVPGMERELLELASALDGLGADFLNLNELEYSETNFERLNERGYRVKDDISAGVLGSERTARRVLRGFGGRMAVHYCSSSFKDGVQLRKRLLRRAGNVAREYQVITADGTLLTGIVEGPPGLLRKARGPWRVPGRLCRHDRRKGRLELAPWLLGALARKKGVRGFIVEEYPTADGLEVERHPA